MSMFLGPIHYWLYSKIGNQEKMTKYIAGYARQEGWISEINSYIKKLPPLEDVIDESNIHAWLEAQIADAETRYAELITDILKADSSRINKLCAAAFQFGKAHKIEAVNAAAAYNAFDEFFVNGMPCDHVNTVTEQSEDRISWEMTQDIHARYWNGSSKPYYAMRKSLMEGMLDGTGIVLQMSDTSHYTVFK